MPLCIFYFTTKCANDQIETPPKEQAYLVTLIWSVRIEFFNVICYMLYVALSRRYANNYCHGSQKATREPEGIPFFTFAKRTNMER